MKAKAVIAAIIVMFFAGCATAPKQTANLESQPKKVEQASTAEKVWKWVKDNSDEIATGVADGVLFP